jgi:hypothetical protein
LTPIREKSSASPELKKGKNPVKLDLELGLKMTKIGGALLDISDL